jgi:serine/threonine protein kinase/formylglycine-generating enzyme required for sulfatase activity
MNSLPLSREQLRGYDALRQIDVVCDAFEDAWRRGLKPMARDYVDLVEPENQRRLFRELIMLEQECLAFHGHGSQTGWTSRGSTLPSGRSDTNEETGTLGPSPSQESDMPSHIDRYVILRELGRGSYGVVYEAEDVQLRRNVALKVAFAPGSHGLEARTYSREAENAGRADHPAIVKVLNIGTWRGIPFLASELVQGTTLDSIAENASMDFRQIVQIMAELANGIHAAHEAGVIHRDIKPSNIMLERERVRILDFGVAKWIDRLTKNTRDGDKVGTPHYMSPEQARGDSAKVDARSDVFSIGIVLFQLLTGRLPFDGPMVAVISAIQTCQLPSLRGIRPDIPISLEAIVRRCCQRSPEDRYQSAAELERDLRSWLDARPVRAIGTLQRDAILRFLKQAGKVAACLMLTWLGTSVFQRTAIPGLGLSSVMPGGTQAIGDLSPRSSTDLSAKTVWASDLELTQWQPGDLVAKIRRTPWTETPSMIEGLRSLASSEAGERIRQAIAVERARAPKEFGFGPEAEEQAIGQARMVLAAYSLQDYAVVDQALAGTRDPRVRTYFIQQFRPSGLSIGPLLDRFDRYQDGWQAAAVVACLATYPRIQLSEALAQRAQQLLETAFQEHPCSGVHVASGELLRAWGHGEFVERVESRPEFCKVSHTRDWYVNSQGMTMLVVQAPVEILVGVHPDLAAQRNLTPGQMHRLDRPFAIGATVVSQEQWDRFEMHMAQREVEASELPSWLRKYEYCRWLSLRDGLSVEQSETLIAHEDSSCTVNDGLEGYRLPSVWEWECAVRVGTITSFPSGEIQKPYLDRQLLLKYPSDPIGLRDWVQNPLAEETSTPFRTLLKPSESKRFHAGTAMIFKRIYQWNSELGVAESVTDAISNRQAAAFRICRSLNTESP